MKTNAILILLALGGSALAQGPLTPPSGSDPAVGPVNALTPGGLPQATMKTLHQVEPRTAIAGGTNGVTISQSGAYYLTGNIQVASGDGITINASNVTLDLNGFSIMTSATPAAGNGVRLGQGLRNVAIRNGNIGGDGLGGAFTGGVLYVVSGFPQPPSNLRFADLSVAASEYGISTGLSVAACHVERCMVIGGSVHGIQGGIVKDCMVEGGPILGRIVKDSSVTTPGTMGIVADVVENSTSTVNSAGVPTKSVFKAEPRTPISSLPFTITESGSYYFTGNLQFSAITGDAITINASHVNVDLMGFELSSTSAVTGKAIYVPSQDTRGITIRNGKITGNTSVAVSSAWSVTPGGFEYGIRDYSNGGGYYEAITISGCRKDGLLSNAGSRALNVSVLHNGERGISIPFGGLINNCIARENASEGLVSSFGAVHNSHATSNGSDGIFVTYGIVTNCVSNLNGENGIKTNTSTVISSSSRFNDAVDLYDLGSAISFCQFSSSSFSGSVRTGNNPSP